MKLIATLIISLVVALISSVVHTVIMQGEVEEFANKCETLGGVVTQIDMGFKTRFSCSVTSLNHF